MQTTSFPTLSWAVLVCSSQCQAMPTCHHITQAQDRSLTAAEWTWHSLGLWTLPEHVLIQSGDRRTPPEPHFLTLVLPSPRVSPFSRVSLPPPGLNSPPLHQGHLPLGVTFNIHPLSPVLGVEIKVWVIRY